MTPGHLCPNSSEGGILGTFHIERLGHIDMNILQKPSKFVLLRRNSFAIWDLLDLVFEPGIARNFHMNHSDLAKLVRNALSPHKFQR